MLSIDHGAAATLNVTDEDVADIVILSITGGRDIFLSLSARDYLPTSFCNTFELLSRLERPIRSYEAGERATLSKAGAKARSGPVEPPKELVQLTNFLSAHALGEDDLFLAPGDPPLVFAVREALDTGDSLEQLSTASLDASPMINGDLSDEADFIRTANGEDALLSGASLGLLSVADCLLRFLDSLPSVIPPTLYTAALSAGDRASVDDAYRVAASLPALNAVVLTHCLAFLKTLLGRRRETERAALADKLCTSFASDAG